MFRLRTTVTVSLLVLAGATGMSLWMSAWPRLHDRPVEAAVAARQQGAPHVSVAAPGRRVPARQVRPVAVRSAAAATPPAPVYAPSPAYPMEALRANRGGVVTLRVSVDANGRVVAVTVARSSGDPALDAAARQRMHAWRFQAPASGRPMSFDYPVTFRIMTER